MLTIPAFQTVQKVAFFLFLLIFISFSYCPVIGTSVKTYICLNDTSLFDKGKGQGLHAGPQLRDESGPEVTESIASLTSKDYNNRKHSRKHCEDQRL